MEIRKNELLAGLSNSVSLEILESAYAKLDSSWRMEDVCSPFSRIYYVLDGEGELYVEEKQIRLVPGRVYLVPMGLNYGYNCRDYLEKVYFHINITMPDGMDLFQGHRMLLDYELGQKGVDHLAVLQQSGELKGALELQSTLLAAVAVFAGQAGVEWKLSTGSSRLLQQLYAIVQHPVSARNTVRSLAAQLHLSESALSRSFKKETGVTLGSYLDQLLMQRLRQLLVSSDMTLKELAEETGFSDSFYLSRYFKTHQKETPGCYRAHMKKGGA